MDAWRRGGGDDDDDVGDDDEAGGDDETGCVAEASPVGVLPLGLRGAHVAALAALLVLFCALVPTGVLYYHEIRMISYESDLCSCRRTLSTASLGYLLR